MEMQLKCVLRLSLKEMALRRLAVNFWSDSQILTSIPLSEVNEKEWKENTEEKIKDKILNLDLPKLLKKQLIDLVRPIGLEIRQWRKFHLEFFQEGLFQSSEEIGLPLLEKLCWTTAGRIDNKKTAEELVRFDGLDLRNRYQLACLYCLEDEIPIRWEKLPEEQKDYFCIDGELLPDLHFIWPHIFKKEFSKVDYLSFNRNLTSFNQWAFEDSVKRANKTAIEYFFHKLTQEEKEASLMRSLHGVLADHEDVYCLAERLSDVLCYLLSLMSPQQQMETIKANPVSILLCFLYWPWQDLFWENAGLIWTFIPSSAYDDLLHRMIDIFNTSYFPKSFQEFFKQSPLSFKEYFLEHACRFLSIFFSYEDSESIEVMFKNVHAAGRVKLVLNPEVLELFFKSILRDRGHLVELCLREAMLSKSDRNNLKVAFMTFLERRRLMELKVKTFFEFLDKTDI